MGKNYYLLFGSNRAIEDIVFEFNEKLDFVFEDRSSDYIGEYSKYIGGFADKLSIEPNLVSGNWKEETHKEYSSLIFISFYKGKNKDRKSMVNHLKQILFRYFDDVFLLREKIYSDKNELIYDALDEDIKQYNRRKINRQSAATSIDNRYLLEEE